MRHSLYLDAHGVTYIKHVIGLFYYDHVLLIMGDILWASWIFIDGGKILGGLLFMLPLGGNTFSALDQQTLHTNHKWRRGQHGVSYGACHIHIFIPPSFLEFKVERVFYELPCLEVAHVVWMISLGWEIHMWMVNPNSFQISCLKNAHRQPIFASIDVYFLHDSYLGCSPKSSLHMLEGKLGDILMRKHVYLMHFF